MSKNNRLLFKKGFWARLPIISRTSINKRNRWRLKNKSFSIISSNCTGGVIYHDLGLRFDSPFINLYILPDDYLKLLHNLPMYLAAEMTEERDTDCEFPVGRLLDIHIYFKHYSSFAEAVTKWNERKKRINYDNLFVLFCDRDGCSMEHIKIFEQLPFAHKVCFTHVKYPQFKSTVYIKGFDHDKQIGVITDYKHPRLKVRYLDAFDYVKWLNCKKGSEV